MFCLCCETILELEPSDTVACLRCRTKNKVDPSAVKTTVKEYSRHAQRNTKAKGARIRQQCPGCLGEEMYYNVLQLRSADEGQTVLYECDCGYRSKLHS